MNGRKLPIIFGLLRNSTIFRCAKNSDSHSARRKPPKMMESLSRGLIVHRGAPPAGPPSILIIKFELITSLSYLDVRALPVYPFESIRPC
ncbi:MAG: hypothetical protein KA135_10795, partial [Halioglobus sp.]|nr:hypothetical protein [Halioglobus sp.]